MKNNDLVERRHRNANEGRGLLKALEQDDLAVVSFHA